MSIVAGSMLWKKLHVSLVLKFLPGLARCVAYSTLPEHTHNGIDTLAARIDGPSGRTTSRLC